MTTMMMMMMMTLVTMTTSRTMMVWLVYHQRRRQPLDSPVMTVPATMNHYCSAAAAADSVVVENPSIPVVPVRPVVHTNWPRHQSRGSTSWTHVVHPAGVQHGDPLPPGHRRWIVAIHHCFLLRRSCWE
jgi:hypothetical protein